jgi:hypothetical protein
MLKLQQIKCHRPLLALLTILELGSSLDQKQMNKNVQNSPLYHKGSLYVQPEKKKQYRESGSGVHRHPNWLQLIFVLFVQVLNICLLVIS